MSTPAPATGWVKAGLIALPLYGLVLAYTTRTPQPDQESDAEGWAEFVSSSTYLIEHVASSVIGPLLVISGTAALGAFLAHSRVRRSALWGAVLAIAGQVLFMVPGAIATFGTPPIGTAYLQGHREVMELQFSPLLGVTTLLGLVLTVVGNVLLGVAAWRSGVLPRWTAALWVAATLVFYVLGAALGMATTGASLVTQPVGGVLMAVSATGMAVAAVTQRKTTRTEANARANTLSSVDK